MLFAVLEASLWFEDASTSRPINKILSSQSKQPIAVYIRYVLKIPYFNIHFLKRTNSPMYF